jgi:hypothetical protein
MPGKTLPSPFILILIFFLGCSHLKESKIDGETYYLCLQFKHMPYGGANTFVDSSSVKNRNNKIRFIDGKIYTGSGKHQEQYDYSFQDSEEIVFSKHGIETTWYVPTDYSQIHEYIFLSKSGDDGISWLLVHENRMEQAKNMIENYIEVYNLGNN